MDLTAFVEGFVHEPTQTEGTGVDLTVGSIFRVTAPGRVDFGGGELEAAEREPVATGKRDPDDDYGWLDLTDGVYLLSHNEALSIPADRTLVLQTRSAVLDRGAFHPTIHVTGDRALDGLPFAVGAGGIRIKENARVSTLHPA